MGTEFTSEASNEYEDLVAQYDQSRAALLPVLHLAQREFGCITPEVEEYVAGLMGLPVVKVHEVVTFYTLYNKTSPGKHTIRVCCTLSCHLLGAEKILGHVCKKVGLENGSNTTPDGRFTIQRVECLGACELAPMMQVDERYYGPLTPEKIDEIVDGLPDEPVIENIDEPQ